MRVVDYGGEPIKVSGRPGDPYFDNLSLSHGTNDLLVKVARELPQDAVIADIGANIGLTSVIFSRSSPAGSVYCFEPSPRTLDHLNATLLSNDASNCQVYPLALSNRVGMMSFLDNMTSASASHLTGTSQTLGGANCEVETTTLDLFIEQHGISRLDLMKIDVEGFEMEVLEGAVRTIERLRPALLIEFNSFTLIAYGDKNPRSVLKYLLDTFPHVYRLEGGKFIEIRDEPSQLVFIHANLIKNRCVDDLFCRF